MKQPETLLEELTRKFPRSEIVARATEGDWMGAYSVAAGNGLWGIWRRIGEAHGFPSSEADKQKWLASRSLK